MFPDPITPANLLEQIILPDMMLFVSSIIGTMMVLNPPVRRDWWRILLIGAADTAVCTISYIYLSAYIPVRIVLWIFISCLVVKAVFATSWRWVAAIEIVYWIVQTLAQLAFMAMLALVLGASTMEIPWTWDVSLMTLLPACLSTLVFCYAISFVEPYIKRFLNDIWESWQIRETRRMLVALIVQLVLVVGIFSDMASSSEAGAVSMGRTALLASCMLLTTASTIYIIIQAIKMAEARALMNIGKTVSDSIDHLAYAMRSQRHDFVNHIQVVEALYYGGKLADLEKYFRELNQEIAVLNEMVKVNSPIISGLLNAKIARANTCSIDFDIEIAADLSSYSGKIIDLVRIMSNLIDNAIEAVEDNEAGKRWIKLGMEARGPLIELQITNPGIMTQEAIEAAFQPGYSLKKGGHAGLGLYIVRDLAEKMGGFITCTAQPQEEICFCLQIPRL